MTPEIPEAVALILREMRAEHATDVNELDPVLSLLCARDWADRIEQALTTGDAPKDACPECGAVGPGVHTADCWVPNPNMNPRAEQARLAQQAAPAERQGRLQTAVAEFTGNLVKDFEVLNEKAMRSMTDAMMEKIVVPLIAERDALLEDLRTVVGFCTEEREFAEDALRQLDGGDLYVVPWDDGCNPLPTIPEGTR